MGTYNPPLYFTPTPYVFMENHYQPNPHPEQQYAPDVPGPIIKPSITPNPFIKTSEDNRSTFAADVNASSYTNARTTIQDGQQLHEQD